MIGKKQTSDSKLWEKEWENIENIASRSRIYRLSIVTAENLTRIIKERGYTHITYGWSGGKDSLVLQKIIEMAKIKTEGGILALYPTEYPQMRRWLLTHKPSDCVAKECNGPTLKDINSNLELLFPNKSEFIEAYLPQRWKVQREFRASKNSDCFLTGRRKIDGNNCGSKANDYITHSKWGDTLNILAEWTHEDVLAFIKFNNIELPPCYFYPNSWRFGTHCWTERKRLDNFPYGNFDELMTIDKDLLPSVRKELKVVDEYLLSKNL